MSNAKVPTLIVKHRSALNTLLAALDTKQLQLYKDWKTDRTYDLSLQTEEEDQPGTAKLEQLILEALNELEEIELLYQERKQLNAIKTTLHLVAESFKGAI